MPKFSIANFIEHRILLIQQIVSGGGSRTAAKQLCSYSVKVIFGLSVYFSLKDYIPQLPSLGALGFFLAMLHVALLLLSVVGLALAEKD